MTETNNIKPATNSRLPALDIARLIAMLMMVQGHTIFALLDTNIIASGKWYWELWTAIRGFTAPVFLLVSGAVHIFANKRNADGALPNSTLKKRLKICAILLLIGYLLQFPANSLYDIPFISQEGFYKLFTVNVLQMFAISLALLNLIFKLTKNNYQLMIVAFISSSLIFILSPIFLNFDWFAVSPNFFASFLSMKHGTIFPLLPFTGYLLLGSVVGVLIQKHKPQERNDYIAKRVPGIAIIYIILGVILCLSANTKYAIASQISASAIFTRAGVGLLGIASSAWLYKYISTSSHFENLISMFSKRALFIYVIHLLIIYGSPVTPGLKHLFHNTDVPTAMYCAFFVIFFTLLIVYVYDKTYKRPKFIQFYKYLIVAMLVYMLFL